MNFGVILYGAAPPPSPDEICISDELIAALKKTIETVYEGAEESNARELCVAVLDALIHVAGGFIVATCTDRVDYVVGQFCHAVKDYTKRIR